MLLVPVQESASGMCVCILMRCVVFVDGTAPSDSIKNIKNVEWNGRETKLLIHHNSGCAREIITYREDYPSETIPSEPASVERRPNPMLFVLKIEINYIYLRQCRLENFSILHDLFITARLGCEKRPAREIRRSSEGDGHLALTCERKLWRCCWSTLHLSGVN